LRWYRAARAPTPMPAVVPAECGSCAAAVPVAIGRDAECPFCTAALTADVGVIERAEATAAQRIATEQARIRTARRWMRIALTLLVAQAVFAVGLEIAGSRLHLW
jgi:hypothetical protein